MSLPLGVWLSPGATQRGLAYQKRVSAALDAVTPILARTVQQNVTDPMERFRQVEQRLQPRRTREPTAAQERGRMERMMPVAPTSSARFISSGSRAASTIISERTGSCP